MNVKIARTVWTIFASEVVFATGEFDNGGVDAAVSVGGDRTKAQFMVGPGLEGSVKEVVEVRRSG